MNLKLNIQGIKTFLDWEKESSQTQSKVTKIHNILHKDYELQKKYLGWLDLPLQKNIISDIKKFKN